MTYMRQRARGFTLVEVVVVITISAIIAVFMVSFLGTPIDAYFAQTRRAALVDSADHILRALAPDVRTALPNSLRANSAGGVFVLEMLATTAVARYYYAPLDKAYLNNPLQESLEELTTGQPDTSFYTFDQTNQFATANGSYLAIENPLAPSAYAFGNVMTPAPPPPQFTIVPVGATFEDQVQLAGAGFKFSNASPTNSVFLVTGPIAYVCDQNAQTLQRFTNYNVSAAQYTSAAQLLAANGKPSLIAQNVTACNPPTIVPAPASGTFNQLVIFQLTLASSGESLQVFDEAATEFVP